MSETPVKAPILAVTPEHHLHTLIAEVLEKEGYALTFCETGGQALEMVHRAPFEVLITDNALTDMPGLDLIKQVAGLGLDVTPVIISDVGSLEAALEGMKLGVHDYMLKPLNPSELKRNVAAIMSERDRARQGAANFQQVVSRVTVRPVPDMVVVTLREDDTGGTTHVLHSISKSMRKIRSFFWDVEEREGSQ